MRNTKDVCRLDPPLLDLKSAQIILNLTNAFPGLLFQEFEIPPGIDFPKPCGLAVVGFQLPPKPSTMTRARRWLGAPNTNQLRFARGGQAGDE